MNIRDLTNQKFGKLTALSIAGRDEKQRLLWLCSCECGGNKIVKSYALISGETKSCGCLWHPLNEDSPSFKTGLAKTRFWNIWSSMKQRGTGKVNRKIYAENDITICDEWLSFDNFKNDMYESYLMHCEIHGIENTSIDRKENDKGYFKTNCRWATPKIQSRNRRSNVMLTFNGETLCLEDWSSKVGINSTTIKRRVNAGWDIKRCLYAPKQKNKYA